MTWRHRSAVWGSAWRSWMGLVAACLAVGAAVWLLAFYVHARVVTPIEKVLVDSLKLKAKTDGEIQKVLVPELERQHLELVRRRNAYRGGGLILLVSMGLFLAWFTWLRPRPGEWGSVPPRIVLLLEGNWTHPVPAPQPKAASQRSSHWTLPAADVVAGPAVPLDLGPVNEILESEGRGPESVIPILQAIQARYRYLPDAALRRVCDTTAITPAQIAGVSSFYGQFRRTPTGEHLVRVCEGTACHVAGADEVRTELRRCLGIGEHADTDPAGRFTIERVACIGSCSLAPVMTIDERIYAHVSALSAGKLLQGFVDAGVSTTGNGCRGPARPTARREDSLAERHPMSIPVEIRIGLGSCGIASGAEAVLAAIEREIALLEGGVSPVGAKASSSGNRNCGGRPKAAGNPTAPPFFRLGRVTVKAVGCAGLCHDEPLVEVIENGRRTLYGKVEPGDARGLVRRHVTPRGVVGKIRAGMQDVRARLFDDRAWTPISDREIDAAPYVAKQVRIVLENCGVVDPLSIEDYRHREGMRALDACLTRMTPEDVIEQVRAAGLRGRGGAGFPTATKWDLTRRADGSPKYVIGNGDEGDPGAFMDRAVMEADPFRVVEGLAIAAYAVGAGEGFVYVRREYPLAVRHMRAAIATAEAQGYLGANILGSPFSFTLRVREGAGAFVCGEETALIQSIEGQRGMPRPRPPYPAQSGLWGKPTLINNVETVASLPWIIRHGPDAFAAWGTATSKGTKVFSLAGKVNRGGLIEVPMGITIREIVEDIGGGIAGGRTFKAVLAGGPSGGCIPASLADARVDYEDLAQTGAIMGSGGLVVLDDRDCAVEIARYFLHFTQEESCGKCTFCRVGTKRMLEILDRICAGKGKEGDLQTLDELSLGITQGSLCGLGQTAPNPVLTTLRYFREEYEAHIREGRCPAGVCKALIHYRVLDTCTGCTLCAQACPAGAIDARPYRIHEVADDLCTRCGMCVTACPEQAIEVR